MLFDPDELSNFVETTTESGTISDMDDDIWIENTVNIIYLIYTPTVVILGLFGNSMSLFTIYGSVLKLQGTSQYLSALACSDSMFLLLLIPPWLNAIGATYVFNRYGFCQVFVYLSYVSCSLSSWLVVAFTVERFVAVVFPLHQNAKCSVTRARQVISGLVFSAVFLNFPVMQFAAPTTNGCNINRKYLKHAARFNMVDTFFTFTLPLILIMILNTWIMACLSRLERNRKMLMRDNGPLRGRRLRLRRLAVYHKSQHKVTRMVVLVSTVYVLLNLPAYGIRMAAYGMDFNEDDIGRRWTAVQQIAVMCFNTNFSINFFLYCLSGQNYRRALWQALPWNRPVVRRAAAVRFANPPQICTTSVSNFEPTVQTISASTSRNVNPETTIITVEPRQRQTRRATKDKFIRRWTFDNSRQRRNNDPDPVPVHGQENVEMRWFGAIGRYTAFPPTLSRP